MEIEGIQWQAMEMKEGGGYDKGKERTGGLGNKRGKKVGKNAARNKIAEK